MNKYFHATLLWVCDYVSMLGLDLIHVSKTIPQKLICPNSVQNERCLTVASPRETVAAPAVIRLQNV